MDIFPILKHAVSEGASDIHLAPKRKPMMRLRGHMVPVGDHQELTADTAKGLIYSILLDDQKMRFEEALELDCSYVVPGFSRFRVNVHMQKDGVGAVLRVIQEQIPRPEDLALEPAIIQLTDLPRGLVLVTGPTGSGKSTTLAAMINLINEKRSDHILSIEDPIEFVHPNKMCVVTQREVGSHTHGFERALRAALREDPDVILVGELRDLETIQLALTASETGHLVFATLHTTDAAQTIDRIVDVFPGTQQSMVRTQLSVALKAVVCQTLLPRADQRGRVAAREIMLVTPAIGTMIRDGKTQQIHGVIDTSSAMGMVSLERSLERLVRDGLIEPSLALSKANKVNTLTSYLGPLAMGSRS